MPLNNDIYGILEDGTEFLLTPDWLEGWMEDEQAGRDYKPLEEDNMVKAKLLDDSLLPFGETEEMDLRTDYQLQKFDDQVRLVLHPCMIDHRKKIDNVEICYDQFNNVAGVIIYLK